MKRIPVLDKASYRALDSLRHGQYDGPKWEIR